MLICECGLRKINGKCSQCDGSLSRPSLRFNALDRKIKKQVKKSQNEIGIEPDKVGEALLRAIRFAGF